MIKYHEVTEGVNKSVLYDVLSSSYVTKEDKSESYISEEVQSWAANAQGKSYAVLIFSSGEDRHSPCMPEFHEIYVPVTYVRGFVARNR